MNAPLSTSKMMTGVFAYLDAVLCFDDQAKAGSQDHGVGIGSQQWDGFRAKLAKQILHTFRTQFWGSPLKPILAEFNLFNQEDMSDALAAAYCRYKAGRDPVEALNADYGINHGGLLSWVDMDKFRADAADMESSEARVWGQFIPEFKSGDRIVHFSLPTSLGYMLVRGDRLVWSVSTLHMSINGVSPSRNAATEKFKALGGYKGFFAGEFTWPPAQ